jgi:hypothetical protein
MSEDQWRSMGVQQSLGWEHYMIHSPGTKKHLTTLIPKQNLHYICDILVFPVFTLYLNKILIFRETCSMLQKTTSWR